MKMDNKISINEVMEEVKRMEDELIKERKESGERRESLFSHYFSSFNLFSSYSGHFE